MLNALGGALRDADCRRPIREASVQRLGAVARFLLPVSAPGGCLWLSLTTRTVFAIGVNLQSAGYPPDGSAGAAARMAGKPGGGTACCKVSWRRGEVDVVLAPSFRRRR